LKEQAQQERRHQERPSRYQALPQPLQLAA
jgi:hypothetical protein